MPTSADEIILALSDNVRMEARRGRQPVSVRIGAEVRRHLAAASREHAPHLTGELGSETLLGIPVDAEAAIDPAGIAVAYEPKA